ncbi:hypothetical protein J3A83DRAFT_4191321 [Scleroderma citrinum]
MNTTVMEGALAVLRYRQLTSASAALLLYDYVISLDDEIEYFWKRSWSLSKSLYIVILIFATCRVSEIRLSVDMVTYYPTRIQLCGLTVTHVRGFAETMFKG